ncbi:MAG: hypothetical protein K0B81_04590 [Candidatus Cloacimonetes bacterium]|nr:hypothetical protein [Candidatus Cloacimonadota bacterium]
MYFKFWIALLVLIGSVTLWGIEWDDLAVLTPEQKIFGLSLIWKEADYNYPHFSQLSELDWDSDYRRFVSKVIETENIYEYYRTIQQFAALLQDCHTRVIYPQSFAAKLDFPLVQLKRIESRIIVTNVGKKHAEVLPMGSEIIEVENLPIEQYFLQEAFPYISASNEEVLYNKGMSLLFFGEKDSEVMVKFRYPADIQIEPQKRGTIEQARLVRSKLNDRWSVPLDTKEELLYHKWLDDDILYVALYSFNDELIIRLFDSILPELQRCKGLILDLRENRWGRTEVSNEILKRLTDRKIFRGVETESRKNVSLYKAWGTPIQLYNYLPPEEYAAYGRGDVWQREEPVEIVNDFDGEKIMVPLVILMGSETASAAEDFVVMLKEARDDVMLVGSHSAGSRGQAIILMLPGGGYIFVSTQRDIYGDGKILTRYGVEVDVEAEWNYKDYLEGRDTVLERGVEVLKELRESDWEK